MAVRLNIKGDTDDIIKQLSALGIETKGITVRILRYVMKEAKKKVRASYGAYIGKKTGKLYKSFFYKVNTRKLKATLGSATGWILGAHEKGSAIVPKKHKYLCFQVNGTWVKTKEVNLQKRPVISAPTSAYKNEITADVRKKLDEEIAKFNAEHK